MFLFLLLLIIYITVKFMSSVPLHGLVQTCLKTWTLPPSS